MSYQPSKWIIEKQSDTSYCIINRLSGDIIAEDLLSHAIASKMTLLLNEGCMITSNRFVNLLRLNQAFETKTMEFARTKSQEVLAESTELLRQIREV